MKNPNKCRYIMFIVVIIGLIIAGISAVVFGVDSIQPLLAIGVLVSFGGLIIGIVTIRCPFCNRLLHLKGIVPDEFCPHCGKKIH